MFVSSFTKPNLNFPLQLNHPFLTNLKPAQPSAMLKKSFHFLYFVFLLCFFLYFAFQRKHWWNLPDLICIYVFPACVLSWRCIDKYRRGINNLKLLRFLSICICGFELMTSPCDLYQFINPGCALGLPQAQLPCW